MDESFISKNGTKKSAVVTQILKNLQSRGTDAMKITAILVFTEKKINKKNHTSLFTGVKSVISILTEGNNEKLTRLRSVLNLLC